MKILSSLFLILAICCDHPQPLKTAPHETAIAEQTFSFNDSVFGTATFIPTIDESASPTERLNLYIQPKGKDPIKLTPPQVHFSFYRLLAVSFEDINHDGLLDILLIAQYTPGAGPHAAEPFEMPLIYLRNPSQFTFEDQLGERILIKSKGRIDIGQVRALFPLAQK